MSLSSDLDTIANVLWFSPLDPLNTFTEMLQHVFLWALFSSIFIHVIAALISFGTLRKHHVGRFFPILVLTLGIVTNAVSGLITSAAIAFVYRASSLHMSPFYAFIYGVGQTIVVLAFSFTRILATL